MGEWGVRACLALNHLFPRRPHPFNLALAGDMRYTEWQFQQAEEVLRRYQRLLSTSASASSADTWCRGRRLLDLGCGAGGKSVFFALQGAEVVGVDLAADLCRQGEELAATRGVSARCRFQVGDAAALPFSTASFDIVLASDVIEHLAQVEAAVAECWRVLRPGGLLLVDFSPY
ncbi:MAG TPA: class I SAM-dependent methyltransferase, partial [Firmicutes bacterium]|nr:class I SAM-dependent methyltransferase [Bacillota bacterium]